MGIYTNIHKSGEITGYTPDARRDVYDISDKQRDHNYWHNRICSIMRHLSSDKSVHFYILYGGKISDAGSGRINISEGAAIGADSDGNSRLIEIPNLTDISIPIGWNDNRQIWVPLQYDSKYTSLTRYHSMTEESYHYELEDSYKGESNYDNLFIDSDPNSTLETVVCLGSFQMNGTSYSAFGERTRIYPLSSDGSVPVGSIISWVPGYFSDTSNGGYYEAIPSLPSNWQKCDGSEFYDEDSSIYNVPGRYLPKIDDDRFLMGSTILAQSGGSNSMAHTHSVPKHYHGLGDLNIVASGSHHHSYYTYVLGSGTSPINTGSTHGGVSTQTSDDTHSHSNADFSGSIGCLSAYGGVSGDSNMTSGASPTEENRPKYLSCNYIQRVK